MKDSRMLKEELLQGNYEELFREIYQDDSEAKRQNARYAQAVEKFEELFGEKQVEIYSAPGRSEVGGNHTDHQHGMVLATSINLDAVAVVSPVDSPVIQLVSEGYDMVEVDTRDLEEKYEEEGTTAALIRGAAAALAEKGYKIGGFQAYITSDVLIGAGLSSSAAFEVIVGTIISGLFNNMEIDPVEIAKAGQYAENVYFGKPCGLMDQTACAVGGVITIDFKDPAHPIVGQAKLDLAKHGYVLCISDTKGSHADLTDDYAAIRREMESVAACFGQKVLRDVPEADFYAAIPDVRKKVGDRAVVRAIHFYNDCRRAAELCQAVQNDEFDKFLRLIIEGGHSSFEFNQNAYSIKNPKEQGVSLALALSQNILNGRGAWRLQGGGFAGTIQAFVPEDLVDAYRAAIDGCFGAGSCHVLNIRNYGAVPVTPEL